MLIVRAPVRVSLAGGGSDLPAYFEQFGGEVVSFTIDKYIYIFVNVWEGRGLQITSSDYRTFYRHSPGDSLLWEGDLQLPRTVMHYFGIEHGLSVFLASEIPPGTGLGSSSSVTVALVKAISTARGLRLQADQIADLACKIEIGELGMPIGRQDQYASAFGGINHIRFTREGTTVEGLKVSPDTLAQLEQNLCLFFTGSSRNSAQVLKAQSKASQNAQSKTTQSVHLVKGLVAPMRETLLKGELRRVGELLHQNWVYKKQFAPGISNSAIDDYYNTALEAGAIGGKVTGAGGGGFLMIYCEGEARERVTCALEAKGLRRMDFRIEHNGAHTLINSSLTIPDTPSENVR